MKFFTFLFLPIALLGLAQDDLFDFFKIPTNDPIEEVLDQVRECWLQEGKERWHYQSRYENDREVLWPLFEEMGLIDEVKPCFDHYETVVVFGALLSRVRDRIQYLSSLEITYDEIVFFTGQRPLLDSEKEKLPEYFEMEIDMVKWVYEHSDLPKHVPVTFVNAYPVPGNIRPRTIDTVSKWLEENPNPSSCLAISNQPYVQYQNAVINRFVPFQVETVGPYVLGNPSVDLILDTFARTLIYQYGEVE